MPIFLGVTPTKLRLRSATVVDRLCAITRQSASYFATKRAQRLTLAEAMDDVEENQILKADWQ